MRIWLITVGEPLPMDDPPQRPHRTGMLAHLLAESGHDVVWWTSSFDHMHKQQRCNEHRTISISEQLCIRMLHGRPYGTNVSLRRIVNHVEVARAFTRLAEHEPPPQIILCSLPTIELSLAATEYGRQRNVPVVLDVRDLWPDIFATVLPPRLRPLAEPALSWYRRQARRALAGCDAIIGVSEGYLQWGLGHARRAQRLEDAVFPLGYQPPQADANQVAAAGERLRALGVDPTKTICWFVGVFGKTYDLATVIHAARRLAGDAAANLQFVLSGNGERYSEWSGLAQGLTNVTFTGFVDAAEIAYMLRVARIGLAAYAPGAPQGLPNKLFEYISGGLPVLSSLSGEAAAFLESNHCGLTYVAGDSRSFEHRLQVLVCDPELRRQMGRNGSELFQRRYAAETVYKQLINYLEHRALGGRVSPSA